MNQTKRLEKESIDRNIEKAKKRRRVNATKKKRKSSVSFLESNESTSRKKMKVPSDNVEPERKGAGEDNPVRNERYNLRPRISPGTYRGHSR